MELKDFIPPIAYRVSRRHPRGAAALTQYQSYESALQDSDTYEDARVVEVVARKTKAYRDALLSSTGSIVKTRQTLQNMFVLSYVRPERPLDVLELGGACGASYFELSRLLPGRIKSWSVVETPSMAAAAGKMFPDAGVKFFDDLGAAASQVESFDLIVAQGVLQYTSNPLRTLDSLIALRCSYIYVTRTALRVRVDDGVEGTVFTKQITGLAAHGPGELPPGFENQSTTQPLVLVPYEAVASRLPPLYSLSFRFDESEESSLLIGSKTVTVKDMGFLAVREAKTAS
jgi:putative methyltransferase (TIGR04325 family)